MTSVRGLARFVPAHTSWSLLLLALAFQGCGHQPRPPLPADSDEPNKASQAPGSLRFRDIAATAGVKFLHTNGAAGKLNLPETMGSGCGFLDYDNDGWPDIFLVNSRFLDTGHGQTSTAPTCSLYRNNHNGTFTDVTAGSGLDQTIFGMGCAVGDFDGDGLVDIYVTSALDGSRLFKNLGNGRFTDVAEHAGVRNAGRWATSAAWLDYDRDGKLDLFVTNYVKYHWDDNKDCQFPEHHRTYCNPKSFPAESCRLYRNLGNGRFLDVGKEAGIDSAEGKALGVLVLDYDDDGWPDIAVACDTTPNLLFHNRKGHFVEEAIGLGVALGENGSPRAGMGIDAAYLWNDDRLAIMVSNFANEGLSLFTQNARGSAFIDSSGAAGTAATSRLFLGFGLAFFDADNDGLRDAIVVNGHIDPWSGEHTPAAYAERHLLYHNRGNERLDEIGLSAGDPFSKPRVSRGLAIADFDRDGKLDALVSNNGQEAELLHNESGSTGHWISIQLQGTKSNRDAIGATVRLTAGATTQRDWVRSGSSYCSQSAFPLHFGLGQSSQVEAVEVRWPSGLNSRYLNVKADRHIRIIEGNNQVLEK